MPQVFVVPVILLFESMLYVERSQMFTGPMPWATAKAEGHVDWRVSFAATVIVVCGGHAIPVPVAIAPLPEVAEPEPLAPLLDPELELTSLLLLLLHAARATRRPP